MHVSISKPPILWPVIIASSIIAEVYRLVQCHDLGYVSVSQQEKVYSG